MEQARRQAVEDHVHRIAPMGARVLIIGIWYNARQVVDGDRAQSFQKSRNRLREARYTGRCRHTLGSLRLIFLGPERMANEAINCALNGSSVPPALEVQKSLANKRINLRVG